MHLLWFLNQFKSEIIDQNLQMKLVPVGNFLSTLCLSFKKHVHYQMTHALITSVLFVQRVLFFFISLELTIFNKIIRICPAYAVPSSPLYYRCIPSLTSSSSSTVNVTDSTTGTSYTLTDQYGI
jgi:hypothetical protein